LTPERWRQITELFHAARERDPATRDAFLKDACRTDGQLRQEVDAMLAGHDGAGAFGEIPLAASTLGFESGVMLGPYRMKRLIGVGGMGEVYRATDTRLGRDVAIKILPRAFTSDPERLARFEREARVLATLNHPHICALYDVGPDYLVMEYVEGEPVRGPVPLSQALALADQMLDALDTAHRRGITHRDLKPANILLSRTGVKVLDFGLAKIARDGTAGDPDAMIEARSLTAEGSILGTLHYMAPEQIEGRDADTRSDLFGFGVVLYELITGKRPFDGLSQASIIASILKEEPRPLHELQPRTPPALTRVLHTCLEKNPEQRWQSARELRHVLAWVSAEAPAHTPTKSVRWWRGVAATLAVVMLGAAGWLLRPGPPDLINRVELSMPDTASSLASLAVSPDGRSLVFSGWGTEGLWVRRFESDEWRRVPGTEGARSPFWSPDGRYLAFAVGGDRNELRKVDLTGGPPETLCTVPGEAGGSGTWSRDGIIVFGSWGGGSGGPLWRVSQAGGAAAALTQVDLSRGEQFHTWPTFLRDGKHFVYFRSGPPEIQGIYVGSVDVEPGKQSRERILASPLTASYASDHLFFLRAGTLMTQPFDLRHLQLTGAAVPIADAISTEWYGTGDFSVSPSGALVYRAATVYTSQLAWIDRLGKTINTVGPPSSVEREGFRGTDGNFDLSLSPDGKRVVLKDSPGHEPGDLWLVDVASGRRTRFTFRKNAYSRGIWSPDGERIAYAGGNLGDTLFEKPSSGIGDEKLLLKETGLRHFATSWSRDGRFLLYHTENAPKTGSDLWVLPVESGRKPVLLLGEAFNELAGVFSPDMRWIAYVSLETGGTEVYVRPFQVSEQTGLPSLGEGRWQVSKGGGSWPQWRNPQEIVFTLSPFTTSMQAAPVTTSGTRFESGLPQLLPFPAWAGTLAATPDRDRFLITKFQVQHQTWTTLTVVLNWPAVVKK
jgi:serine/threonine protein kinase/Tol biopolymer transport system component